MSDAVWKIIFTVAAVFNFVAGAPALLVRHQAMELLGLPAQPALFAQLAGGLIVMFGVSYALIARNLALHELVWLGAIGKFLAVAVIVANRGEISDRLFFLGLGDLPFALLFLWFLFGGRRTAA